MSKQKLNLNTSMADIHKQILEKNTEIARCCEQYREAEELLKEVNSILRLEKEKKATADIPSLGFELNYHDKHFYQPYKI